jgi:uncharacterized protein YecE (DUF72 family)
VHNAALCVADAETDLNVPFFPTADFGYLRLRRPDYTSKELAALVKRVQDQPWTRAFVFFKHEDAGKGPQFATQFVQILKA